MRNKDKHLPEEESKETAHSAALSKRKLLTLFLGAIVFLSLLLLVRRLNLGSRIDQLQSWIRSLGPWGPLAYLTVYVVGIVAAVSAPALSVLGGVLFGPIGGVIMVSLASTISVTVCFLIARHFAREKIYGWLSRFDKFKQLDELAQKHGALAVLLTRLVPILPFPLINYGFGLTQVPIQTYIFWSWIGMLPGTVILVVGIDAIKSIMASGGTPWLAFAVLGGVFLLLTFFVRFAKKKLSA